MATIKVTFPKHIPAEKIIFILEGNLKKNSPFTCKVEFIECEDDENVFSISSEDGAGAYYAIGMTASAIIEKFGTTECVHPFNRVISCGALHNCTLCGENITSS